jgi:hypothetical protein
MKRLLLLGFVILTFAAPLHATEIFWDESPPPDPTITSDDFKHKYERFTPAKSLEQKEVYDSGEVPDIEEIKGETEAPIVPRPTRSRDTVDTPRPPDRSRDVAPAPPVTRTKRQPAAPSPAAVEPAPTRVAPALAPDEPTAQGVEPDAVEPRRGTPVPAVGGEPTQPEPKKMPWGQEENKTSADQANGKFKWGQPK